MKFRRKEPPPMKPGKYWWYAKLYDGIRPTRIRIYKNGKVSVDGYIRNPNELSWYGPVDEVADADDI